MPDLSFLLYLVPVLLVAILALLWRAWQGGERPGAGAETLLLDGSNVMYWRDNAPDLATVRAVVDALRARGYRIGVMFDANAGYLLFGRYRHDHFLARQLGLPVENVMVVPKGTPADPHLLRAARDMGARIVSDDRFRDWADDYPEVARAGHLIRGGYRDGRLWLELPKD